MFSSPLVRMAFLGNFSVNFEATKPEIRIEYLGGGSARIAIGGLWASIDDQVVTTQGVLNLFRVLDNDYASRGSKQTWKRFRL